MSGFSPEADGGWALSRQAREALATYLAGPGDSEPDYTVAEAWSPPHELALPGDLCDRVLVGRGALLRSAAASGNGDYHDVTLSDDDRAEVIDRFELANGLWWRLDVTSWAMHVKRYGPGDRHAEHQDLHPGATGRKLAGVVQLSEPDDYAGGALLVRFAHHRPVMPRARGSVIAFPGWTCHEVEAVTAGERWMLAVNGWGPRLR